MPIFPRQANGISIEFSKWLIDDVNDYAPLQPQSSAMHEKETILFGMPVPSDDKTFLTIVAIHIVIGIACVLSGLFAMLSRKGTRLHTLAGKTYHIGMILIFITVIILALMRWPFNIHLLVLGILAFLSSHFGKQQARKLTPVSTRLHTILMGSSYILLLTAFYVDNGKNLPFWRMFPQVFFWLFPAAIGIPFIVYALLKHPLNRKNSRSIRDRLRE